MENKSFIWEIDYYQIQKHKENVPGDIFKCVRTGGDRYVAVLADGLGSGVKANVLAKLTAEMGVGLVSGGIGIKPAVESIMKTLPVCSVRKISYSTCTITEILDFSHVRMIEFDNPRMMHIRAGKLLEHTPEVTTFKTDFRDENEILVSNFGVKAGDRLIMFSDGVTQSGLGYEGTPLGWDTERITAFVCGIIREKPFISAKDLSRQICREALRFDQFKAHDDITCAVMYLRRPRKLLVVTGPPYQEAKDEELARRVRDFPGMKVVSGGTTAQIVSRELNLPLEVDISTIDPLLPPASKMPGIDLVTEGILTLSKVADILEQEDVDHLGGNSPAVSMIRVLLDSDMIRFVVGTKINEAHLDPDMPVEIELRRTIIKRIMFVLKNKHLKEVEVEYL